MELVDAGAARGTRPGGGVVVADPDKKIEGELADDESNKRTGPKSRRRHRLGVRKEAGTLEANEQHTMPSDTQEMSDEESGARDREWATIRVQSVYRGHLGRNTYFMMLGDDEFANEQRYEAALCIQCAFRSFKARNEYYDLLGSAEGPGRTPSYEGSLLPEGIWDKYLRAIEENALFAERALLQADGAAKSRRQVRSVETSDRRLQLLLEENAELEKKLAEANDFLKGMNAGVSSTLEVQTLKIQLELKDEELEEMQQSLDEKSLALARLREDVQIARSSDEAGLEMAQRIEDPLNSVQASCQDLEGTLGTLVEAVSTALDSRHKVEMEIGSLQAHAVSLQKKNEVFFFENQGLHSELAELRNEEQKAADLAENLFAQVMETGKTLSATTSALNDLEKLKQQTGQKLSAAESDLKEAGARIESLCAENTSLQGQFDEAEQNREGEATRLREELAASQQALLTAQASADTLKDQVQQATLWRDTQLPDMQAKKRELELTVGTLQSEKEAAEQANAQLSAQLSAQLQQARLEADDAQHRLASLTGHVKELEEKLDERMKLLEEKKDELEALQGQWQSQDAHQGHGIDDILEQSSQMLPVLMKFQEQYNNIRESSLEQANALIQALNDMTREVRATSEQSCLDTALFERLEKEKAELQQDLESAQGCIATAQDELAAQARSADDARKLSIAFQQVQAENEKALEQVQELQLERDNLIKTSLESSEDLVHRMQESVHKLQVEIALVKEEKKQLVEEMMLANEQVTAMLSSIEHGETLQMQTNTSLLVAIEKLLAERDSLVKQCKHHQEKKQLVEEMMLANEQVTAMLSSIEHGEPLQMQTNASLLVAIRELLAERDSLAMQCQQPRNAPDRGSEWENSLYIIDDILLEMMRLGETVEHVTLACRGSSDASEMRLQSLREELAKSCADLHDAKAEARAVESRLQDEREDLRVCRDRETADEATMLAKLEMHVQMNEEMKKSIASHYDTIRRLSLEVEKLKSQAGEHLSQISVLSKDRDSWKQQLLEAVSQGVGMAAINTARFDLISEQTGGIEREHIVPTRENIISGGGSMHGGEGKEEEEAEYCLAIDIVCKLGLGVDVAVFQALQTCVAMMQRIDALQMRHRMREHDLQAELERQRDQERGREQRRDEEREEERIRAREREQERHRDHEEIKILRHSRQESEEHRFLSSEVGKTQGDGSVADKSNDDIKQLEVLLEQKERLLVSQSATVNALETAVDALKGQVQSGLNSRSNPSTPKSACILSRGAAACCFEISLCWHSLQSSTSPRRRFISCTHGDHSSRF